ncbi:MAG: hypothetical protein LKE64_08250 [Solobacterium sp.]|nr:hypothetical protein [Solobacterium sp.]MCH4048780.1 hypothetical protein [Solobacterium sp.]MCH4074466.1 hypothetical protein [Solobacterium sp.]MCI1347214.1 hypothetical protein [Solobacterium sp.]
MGNDAVNTLIEQLRSISSVDAFLKAAELMRSIIENIIRSSSSQDNQQTLHAGNVLLLEILKKMCNGQAPSSFTSEEWKNIAQSVSKHALENNGENYSVYIFTLYARSIEAAADLMKGRIPPEKEKDIRSLSAEIKKKTDRFQKGKLSEPVYVEDCLWICLEAMMKQNLAWAGMTSNKKELGELRESIAMFAYGYARLSLYSREKELMDAYAAQRSIVNKNLRQDFEAFCQQLKEREETFTHLSENAFSDDFRTKLRASAQLAADAGVKEENILHSIAETDDFFQS